MFNERVDKSDKEIHLADHPQLPAASHHLLPKPRGKGSSSGPSSAMAAPRKGQAIVKRGISSTGGKSLPQPNNDTMNYMRETFDMLAIPDSVEFDIPPLDLTGWQDPYAQDESAIAVDSDADDLHNDTDSSFQKRSRASSSSTSQERPIAHAAAKLKQKQQSPPKRKETLEQDAEDGEISNVAPQTAHPKSRVAAEGIKQTKKSRSSPERPGSTSQLNGASNPAPLPTPTSLPEPSVPPHPRATYFSKNKLKIIAAECRSRGRTSKHAGDKRMRSNPSPLDAKVALFEVTDAFLLYVYSFWADDLLTGRLDEHGRLTKPGCRSDNWQTIFGLLHHVRGRADATHTHLIACLCDLIEGMILTHMQRAERRRLHTIVQHAQAHPQHHHQPHANGHSQEGGSGAGAATAGTTPGSNIPTPPSDAASSSAAEVNRQMQDTFLELSTGNERAFQLFRSAQDLLTLGGLRAHLPSFAAKITGAHSSDGLPLLGLAPPDQMSEPSRPWTFAFGIDTNVNYASIGQAVCFGRALLEDLAKQAEVQWRPEWEPLPLAS